SCKVQCRLGEIGPAQIPTLERRIAEVPIVQLAHGLRALAVLRLADDGKRDVIVEPNMPAGVLAGAGCGVVGKRTRKAALEAGEGPLLAVDGPRPLEKITATPNLRRLQMERSAGEVEIPSTFAQAAGRVGVELHPRSVVRMELALRELVAFLDGDVPVVSRL